MSERDALDASLPALLPQIRLTLTQIRLTPDAAAALRRLGVDLATHEAGLRRLELAVGEALVQRKIAKKLLDRARARARELAAEALHWARLCRAALPWEEELARPKVWLVSESFEASLRCLSEAVPAIEAIELGDLGTAGRALLDRALALAEELAVHEGGVTVAAAEVDRLRSETRAALRTLRRVWNAAPGLAPLNVSHAASSAH